MPNINTSESFKEISRITTLFLAELTNWSEVYEEMEAGYKYLAGDHYTKEQKEYYLEQRRPTRSFNALLPMFAATIGDFLITNEKVTIDTLPGGNRIVSEVFRDILDSIQDQNEATHQFSSTVLAGLIRVGWIHARFSDEREVDGSVVFDNVDEFEMLVQSDARKYDLTDADYIFRSKWLTTDQLKKAFPQYKREIEESLINTREHGHHGIYEYKDNFPDNLQLVDRSNGKYRVIEFHERVDEFGQVVAHPSGLIENFSLEGERADLFFKIHPDARVLNRNTKIKYRKVLLPALNLLMEDRKADLQDGSFDYIPFFSYNYGRKVKDNFGLFKNVRDIQNDLNEWHNILNFSAAKAVNPGWIKRPDQIINPESIDEFGNEPGFNINLKPEAGPISEAIQRNQSAPLPVPAQMLESKLDSMSRISGITPNFIGAPGSSNESGVLNMQRLRQTAKNLQSVYSNFALTKRLLIKKMFGLVTHHYTPEKYLITARTEKAQEYIRAQLSGIVKPFSSIDVTRYEISIGDSDKNPTEKLIRFEKKTRILQHILTMFGGAIQSPEIIAYINRWWLKDSDIGEIDEFLANFEQALVGLSASNAEQAENQQALETVEKMVDLAGKQVKMQKDAEQLDENSSSAQN